MGEQTSKHGPRLDDQLAHEVEGLVRSGHRTHAEEWKEQQYPAEDQPDGDLGTVPEGRRGSPPGMTAQEVEERSEIARFLGISAFPGDRDQLLQVATEHEATDAVIGQLRSLPAGQVFRNVQDVAEALGLHGETTRY